MSALATPDDPRGWITPEDLNVAPALLGLPLATPARRALAMGLDLLLLTLLSHWGSGWLLAGLCWAAWRWSRPARPAGWRGWLPVLALLLLGLYASVDDALLALAPERPAAQARPQDGAGDAGELAEAALAVVGTAAEAGPAADAAAQRLEQKAQRHKIKVLEERLQQLEQERELDPRARLRRWVDEVGLNLAWALAYFVMWPLVWPGQTPGKRLLGLQVVELTGKPARLMLNLRRYGGYAAGMATGGMGFLQIFWDANRQAIQDKAAHTAVIDLRNPGRLRLPD